MANILVVTGSARRGRAADKVLATVKAQLEMYEDVSIVVADVKDLNLPFFDNEDIPSSEEYRPASEAVQHWADLVSAADGVVFLMPEYNHSMSAIQKNAIDWLYAEWDGKPVSIVAYGWGGGAHALVTAKTVLENVKAKLLPTAAQLYFMKNINVDGSSADVATVDSTLKTTLDELMAAI